MTEFSVTLSNRPGQLAALAKELAESGVNIEALAAFAVDDHGMVRLMVDDPNTARTALQRLGVRFEEHAVVQTILPNRPGTLAEMTRELADSGVNIVAMYLTNSSPEGLHFAVTLDESAKLAS